MSYDEQLVDASELSESGVVGRISVTNKSNSHLVLLDGEALVGAKQNRIVERSMIIGPQSSLSVPVNCVWSGRGNRTPITSLEGWGNSLYTIPASY